MNAKSQTKGAVNRKVEITRVINNYTGKIQYHYRGSIYREGHNMILRYTSYNK